MKRMIIATAVLVSISGAASAQTSNGSIPKHKKTKMAKTVKSKPAPIDSTGKEFNYKDGQQATPTGHEATGTGSSAATMPKDSATTRRDSTRQ